MIKAGDKKPDWRLPVGGIRTRAELQDQRKRLYFQDWHVDCLFLIASHKFRFVVTGSEVNMKQESIVYLDKVACIASANMVYHQVKPVSDRTEDEAGAALLMGAFLEMYEHWQRAKPGAEPPSERVYIAADACVLMRNELQKQERCTWSDEAEALLQMMTAFMFLFKYMYVPQN